MGAGEWAFWIGGGVAAAGGVALLVWALFADRARGRRRCPRCWYDMAGVPGLRCPECGKTAKKEKRLGRTRRKRRWAALGTLLFALGFGTIVVGQVPIARVAANTPNRLLILVLPSLESRKLAAATLVREELRRRVLTLNDFRALARTVPALCPKNGPAPTRLWVEEMLSARWVSPNGVRDHYVADSSGGFMADGVRANPDGLVIRALGHGAEPVLPMLSEAVGAGDARALALLYFMGEIGAPAAPAVVEVLGNRGYGEMAKRVLWAMGPRALPALIDALEKEAGPGATPLLPPRFVDIGAVLDGFDQNAVIDLAVRSKDKNLRSAAAVAAAVRLQPEKLAEATASSTGSPSLLREIILERSIGRVGAGEQTGARELLRLATTCLDDESPMVRRRACDLLWGLGGEGSAAADKLRGMALDDPDRTVQMAASAALSKVRRAEQK